MVAVSIDRSLARLVAPAPRDQGRPGESHALTPRQLAVPIVALSLLAALLVFRGPVFANALQRALHASWGLVAAGVLLEAASVGGYVLLLHRVVSAASPRLGLRDSCDITLAGTAATRLVPTAGLGGAAVTVWALRSHGVRAREVAERLIAFLLILYGVYMAALIVCGGAVASGLIQVHSGRTVGAIAVAVGAGIPLALAATVASGATGRSVPVLRAAARRAGRELRRPHPALIGALAWWGFDASVLFGMLHAFGANPDPVVLVLAYFMGTLFNVVPLPGSLSGGLAGMLIALGTPAAPALAAVLAYRAMATWLPAAWGLPSLGRLRASAAGWRATGAGAADPEPPAPAPGVPPLVPAYALGVPRS